jgi:hypothetical protein
MHQASLQPMPRFLQFIAIRWESLAALPKVHSNATEKPRWSSP